MGRRHRRGRRGGTLWFSQHKGIDREVWGKRTGTDTSEIEAVDDVGVLGALLGARL